MRKWKTIIVSLSAALLIAAQGMAAYADETEVTEVTSEETADTEGASEAAEDTPEEYASTATVTVAGDEQLSESDSRTLGSYATESISLVTGMSDQEMEDILKPSSILSVPQKSAVTSVESWKNAKEELGEYKEEKAHTITVSDDTITIESVCEFANGEGIVTTVLDRSTLTMDSMTFSEGDASLGKVMEEAAMNTVMGLGIVFLTLLFLSFIIGQFKHISKLENAVNKKNQAAPAQKKAPAAPAAAQKKSAPAAKTAPAPTAESSVMDDGELIAVIAAAIAAYEGTTSTDGFVVRSIKKRNRNKWQRA